MRLTLLALAMACLSSAANENQQEVGAVLNVHGTWQVVEGQALLPGQAVPGNSLIRNRAAQQLDSIVIVLLDGQKLQLDCGDDRNRCAKGIRTPVSVGETSISLQAIVKAVQQVLLDREPQVVGALSHAISRGSRTIMAETVGAYGPEQPLRIADYLNPVPADLDVVELQQIDHQQRPLSMQRITSVDRRNAMITLPARGSYVAKVIRENDEVALNVLIVSLTPAAAEQAKAGVEEARRICASWDSQDDPMLTHKFLRAYLLSMAGAL